MQTEISVKGYSGIYKLSVPASFLSEAATEQTKQVVDCMIQSVQDALDGKSPCVILPSNIDDNGNRLFDLEYVGPDIIFAKDNEEISITTAGIVNLSTEKLDNT